GEPPPEEGGRMVERPAEQDEPGRPELRLKPELPGDIFGGAPGGGEDDEEDDQDLSPEDFGRGHRDVPCQLKLEAEPALAAEIPIDAAAVAGDAGDVAAELLVEGWRPGHELEAEAVVDHGEAA